MPGQVRIQLKIKADAERVFQTLTHTAALENWFCEHAEIGLEAKQYNFWGRFTPDAPDKAAGHHPIVDIADNRLLAYDWHVLSANTRVTFKLLTAEDHTILTLRQANTDPGLHQGGSYSFRS